MFSLNLSMSLNFVFNVSFVFELQSVNDRRDDPDGRQMLYAPVNGCRIVRGAQYLATIIGMCVHALCVISALLLVPANAIKRAIKFD